MSFIIIPNRISFVGQIIENYEKFIFKTSEFLMISIEMIYESLDILNEMKTSEKGGDQAPFSVRIYFFFSKDFNKEEILNGGCAI